MSGAFAGANALAADASNAPVLEEIIVTAEKRSENLQDVPISVVAINAQQMRVVPLVNRSAVFLADQIIESPGVDRNGIVHLSLVKTRTGPR